MIAKTYVPAQTGDALMVEIVEIVGAPEYTEARPVWNTTNLAQLEELGSRAVALFEGSGSRAYVGMFIRREAPYRKEG